MRKITCMLLLIKGGFLMAQTKTVVTQNGEKVAISTGANNGLTSNGGFIQLGGALTKPSVLTTTSAFTLAFQGLQAGNTSDNVLVTDANGVLKYVPRTSFSGADNLGNHIATKALDMSTFDINNVGKIAFPFVNGNKLLFLGDANGARLEHMNGRSLKMVSGAQGGTTAVGLGQFLWSNYSGADATETQLMILNASGNLGIGTTNPAGKLDVAGKTVTQSAQIAKGSDGLSPIAGSVAVAADANGNVKWVPASSIGAGDNLGNHTATTDLAMSGKNINNAANVTATGSVAAANVTASTKATVQTAQITKGSDGASPAAGSVAVAADTNGNVKWVSASSIGAGDNLGNHTATTDLAMSGKNINNAANITATGTVAGANVTASTKATVQTAQITKGSDGASPAAGSVAVAADTNGNVKWIPASSIGAGDNLGNHTATTDLTMSGKNINNAANITATGKTTTQTAQITKGSDGASPAAGSVAVAADTNGNVKWVSASSIGAGDNLGNHTATQNLDMTSKNILNINNAYIKNEAQIMDRVTSNTNYFGIYKNSGLLGIWNNLKGNNALSIDEATNKTTLVSAQIAHGTDGSSPALGSIAVAADANGNVKWVNASSIGAGDNLGNHTATTDLAMSGKNVNNAANVTATGTVSAANVTASTKATVQTAQITKGSDGSTPAAGSVAISADANGNIRWAAPSTIAGATGPQGPKGDTGAQGIQGLTGATGPKGDTGAQGIQGVAGATGPKGDTGAQGIQGLTGATGPQGIQGLTGATGPAGAPPTTGAGTITGRNLITISDGANNAFKNTDISLTAGTDKQVLQTVGTTPTWVNVSSIIPAAAVTNANNGLTNNSGTIQLGGALVKATTINATSSNTLEINTGGTSSSPVSGFKIVDGTQGQNKVLTSDAYGKTRWEAAGITLGLGSLGNGANIANTLTTSSSYVYTNAYVVLPPGRWLVTVNMLLAKTGNAFTAANEFWWVRTTFSNSPSTFAPSGDIQGSNKLVSGGLNPNTNYGLMNGSVTIQNNTTSNKTYYFMAGFLDGQNRAGVIANFASWSWGENSIVFQAVH